MRFAKTMGAMDISKISVGKNPPDNLNVIIEVPTLASR
jgi:hypothetical protein